MRCRTPEQRKRHVQYLARTVEPLGAWSNGPGRGHKAPKTRRKPQVKGGNKQKYLIARIARDRPDVLERMKKGEFLSVQAAAIEAGIVKPKDSTTEREELIPIPSPKRVMRQSG
jgi:hypothetical protein